MVKTDATLTLNLRVGEYGLKACGGDFGQAVFSEDEAYRYSLLKDIRAGVDTVCVFIMLNPSTASHERSDPTVTRCVKWAERWGFGKLVVLNLFALRSTDPKALYRVDDPVGRYNDSWIGAWVGQSDRVVCAWGNHGSHLNRDSDVKTLVREQGRIPLCLGLTQSGQPKHPLARGRAHIPYETELVAL